ncbi:MAG: hypothetical protein KC646_03250 [Candidatus Cloacimonetes bacterium]|nr:hypothetical protein [Candidatus Cloacimonadota bacterium]
MKNIKFLVVVFSLIFISLEAKTVTNWERWQDADDKQPYPTNYKGFKPPTYFMQPTDKVMKSRYYTDTYSLEDHSGYPDPCTGAGAPDCIGAGYFGRRTDNPLEVYYSKILNDGPSSIPWTGSAGGGEIADSGYLTYDTRAAGRQNAGGKPTTPIVLNNMAPRDAADAPIMAGITSAADLFPRYSIRNVAGLLYRGKFDCGTDTLHVSYDSNDVEQRMGGELGTVTDSEYCFFLFLPKTKVKTGAGDVEIGPFIGKASVSNTSGVTPHALSKKFIEAGLTPLMDLKDEYKNLLIAGTDSSLITFVKGRYMVPLKMGDLILPQNGANLMYFRMFANRPYHQERREVKKTKSKGSIALVAFIVVGIFTFGAGLAIGVAVGAALIATSIGAGAIAAYLLKDSAYDRTMTSSAGGMKRNDDLSAFAIWPSGGQQSYMSLHSREGASLIPYQDGTKVKQFVAAFTALEDSAENDLLTQLRGGTIEYLDEDKNPTVLPVNDGYLTHPNSPGYPDKVKDPSGAGFWSSKEALDDPRYFQLLKGGGYSVTGGKSFTAGTGTGIPTAPCASLADTDPAKPICIKHAALMQDLDAYFDSIYPVTDYIYDDVAAGVGEFSGRLYGTTDTVTDGSSHSFPAATEYKKLMEIYTTYEADIETIENAILAPAGGMPPGYMEFFKFTDEGARLANRMLVMQPALDKVAMDYANDWFVGSEFTVLKDRVTADVTGPTGCEPAGGWAPYFFPGASATVIAATETCIGGKVDTILNEYNIMEADAATGLPFITYTTHYCEGQKGFLNALSILSEISQPSVVAPAVNYLDFMDPADKCPAAQSATLTDRVFCRKNDLMSGFSTSLANSPVMAKVNDRSIQDTDPMACP